MDDMFSYNLIKQAEIDERRSNAKALVSISEILQLIARQSSTPDVEMQRIIKACFLLMSISTNMSK